MASLVYVKNYLLYYLQKVSPLFLLFRYFLTLYSYPSLNTQIYRMILYLFTYFHLRNDKKIVKYVETEFIRHYYKFYHCTSFFSNCNKTYCHYL